MGSISIIGNGIANEITGGLKVWKADYEKESDELEVHIRRGYVIEGQKGEEVGEPFIGQHVWVEIDFDVKYSEGMSYGVRRHTRLRDFQLNRPVQLPTQINSIQKYKRGCR
jgi:hypothetical protein